MLSDKQKRFIKFKKFEPTLTFALFLFMLLGAIVVYVVASEQIMSLKIYLDKMEIAAQGISAKTELEAELKTFIIGDIEVYREILLSLRAFIKIAIFITCIACIFFFMAYLNSRETIKILEQLEK